jgi:Tfp pilus assembly protein PilV
MKSSVRSGDHKGQAGFTLLETTIALVVMMIGGLGIAAVFTYAIKNNTGARDRAAAIAVAQQELERLRNLSFNDTALTATGTVSPVTVTSAGRQYSMRTTIQDTTSTVKTIEIQVTPQSSSNPYVGSVTVSAQRAAFTLGAFSGGP